MTPAMLADLLLCTADWAREAITVVDRGEDGETNRWSVDLSGVEIHRGYSEEEADLLAKELSGAIAAALRAQGQEPA